MQSPMLVHRSLVFLAALLDRLLARADLEAGTSGIFSTQHVRRWPQDIDQQSADRRFLALDDRAFCIICAASRPAVAFLNAARASASACLIPLRRAASSSRTTTGSKL